MGRYWMRDDIKRADGTVHVWPVAEDGRHHLFGTLCSCFPRLTQPCSEHLQGVVPKGCWKCGGSGDQEVEPGLPVVVVHEEGRLNA